MTDPKNAKQPGKKLNAAAAQKLRQQLADNIAQLSDEELEKVAGGATGFATGGCIFAPNLVPGPIPGANQ